VDLRLETDLTANIPHFPDSSSTLVSNRILTESELVSLFIYWKI